ncbi:MAG: radical SAM family heme chaperone HemW [Bacteroidetes bacterium]|nr:radical SAM family heme chaperone HemW [Bacteroidota bacterium]
MAGIYLHIPFCKSKCPYCNFFSVASTKSAEIFFGALHEEINLQRHYLGKQTVETIYFGGGTPSLLKSSEIAGILEKIRSVFSLEETVEITLEANPDDITAHKLQDWRKWGINRLSLGLQSFADDDLKYLGRIHSGAQAERSVQLALDHGFSNISVDFIYGMPTLTHKAFAGNLEKVVALGIPHISAYSLTTEPKTALDVKIRKKQMQGPDDEKAISQFRFLMQYLGSCNYEHYEISNFCLPGMYSKHNSSYWKGRYYLGLGPSAHSFNGFSRQWNFSGISRYAGLISTGKPHYETEFLTPLQNYNEYVMISLRTIWGASLHYIKQEFGEGPASYFRDQASEFLAKGDMIEHQGIFTLTGKGKLFADKISSDLFLDND